MDHHRERIKSNSRTKMQQRKWPMTHRDRAKENLKLSYGGPSQRQVSGFNPQIKALRRNRHLILGLTQPRAIKEESIVIDRD